MKKIFEFNNGHTSARGDSYYAITPSTGALTSTVKFEGPGEKTNKFGENL
jgi:hypothetical protein